MAPNFEKTTKKWGIFFHNFFRTKRVLGLDSDYDQR